MTSDDNEQPCLRYRFANAEFDTASWQLHVDGGPVALERRPADVLTCLLRHAGEVVTKEELREAGWPGQIVVDNALTNAIGKLRRALGAQGSDCIETRHGVGYRLNATVQREVVRRSQPAYAPAVGEAVPQRPNWLLKQQLDAGGHTPVWLCEHTKTGEYRVFKFSPDGHRLAALKREATISRLLREALGDRADFGRIIDWNFDAEPYYLECQYGGPNLVEWADTQGGLAKLLLATRIALVARLTETVADAHAVGVLHKDLKPANVLIDGDSVQGTARIVDFGSGGLEDAEQLETYGITGLGFTANQPFGDGTSGGTPLYLAPEVVAGQAATLQSDIYALGVILYQLVIGDLSQPLAPGWEHRITDELLREDIAAATQGDPERRLSSARELATRLRTLDKRRAERRREQQQAERMRAAEERVRRTRARRPWLAATGLALVAGLALSLWQYHQARQAQQIAQSINTFLQQDLIAAANPLLNQGRSDVTVIQALSDAAATIDERFAEQPRVAYELHAMIAKTMQWQGMWKRAREQFQYALEQADEAGISGSSKVLHTRLRYTRLLMNANMADAARKQLAYVKAHIRPWTSDKVVAEVHFIRGLLFKSHGKPDRAIKQFETAMALRPEAHGYNQPLIGLLVKRGQYERAKKLAAEVIHFEASRYGWEHGGTVSARLTAARRLAPIKTARQRLQQFTELAKDTRRTFGVHHTKHWAALLAKGRALVDLGRWQQAAKTLTKTYHGLKALGEQTWLGYHYVVAPLGRAYRHLGKCKQILSRLADTTHLFGNRHGRTQKYTALAATSWAACLKATGATAKAAQVMARFKPRDLNQRNYPGELIARIRSLNKHLGLAQAEHTVEIQARNGQTVSSGQDA